MTVYVAYAGLFLGIWNWGGIDKCLGGVNMRKVQIYIKKHFKKGKNYTELGGGVSSLNFGGDRSFAPPLGWV